MQVPIKFKFFPALFLDFPFSFKKYFKIKSNFLFACYYYYFFQLLSTLVVNKLKTICKIIIIKVEKSQ